MDFQLTRFCKVVLRLSMGIALLAASRLGSADGRWSIVRGPGGSDGLAPLVAPTAVATDAVDNFYVADDPEPQYPVDPHYPMGRILERDVQGNWSLVAPAGAAVGEVHHPTALAVDGAGNLYTAEADVGIYGGQNRIQRRDAQGHWSVLADYGSAPGQVDWPRALAADASGELFVAEGGRIQKRDPQGNWSVIATQDPGPEQIRIVPSLAADSAGNLYVADVPCYWCDGSPRIQKRDARGNWSTLDPNAGIVGLYPLAADGGGSLYVAGDFPLIWRRDVQGGWSVAAMDDSSPAQLTGLAVDGAGNMYVADYAASDYAAGPLNVRLQEYVPGP